MDLFGRDDGILRRDEDEWPRVMECRGQPSRLYSRRPLRPIRIYRQKRRSHALTRSNGYANRWENTMEPYISKGLPPIHLRARRFLAVIPPARGGATALRRTIR